MFLLNLPQYIFSYKTIEEKKYIFDIIRKKYVRLFPEEWVRQNFIRFLIEKGYPKGLMSIEETFLVHTKKKKTDILVYTSTGTVFMLVECKSPKFKLNNTILEQSLTYNLKKKAQYLTLTNGIHHLFFYLQYDKKTLQKLTDIPHYLNYFE